MELFITLPGSIRSKKNSKRIFARGPFKRVLPSKAYEEWERQARNEAWAQVVRDHSTISPGAFYLPMFDPCQVEAHFYYRGPRPDLSGCLESIADAMQGFLWANDRQIVSWDGSRLHHDKANPRTEIRVEW